MKIAVLLTSFNRKEKTMACLGNLYDQILPENLKIEVFICDDNSSDGTRDMLAENFPQVKVIRGDGHQYWCGGMRMAWESARQAGDYEFYLWLNDDTFLLKNSIMELLEEYNCIGKPAILAAACKRPRSDEFSYGGQNNEGAIIPNGHTQEVMYINGNFVLIPEPIMEAIGIISDKYTHSFGDYDYGLRAQKSGFSCYTTSRYLAECEINSALYYADPRLSLVERWERLHHVKGMALSEYVTFKTHHYGKWKGIKTRIDCYLKALFPNCYMNLKKFIKGLPLFSTS